jgi:hypothetical protein
LFLWPVGELEAELFVQLGLVGRVGMSEHVEVVAEAGDDPGDLVVATIHPAITVGSVS